MTKKRDRKKEAAASPAPVDKETCGAEVGVAASGRPTWRQTGWLLAGGWGALVIFALLWRLWTGRALIIYFAAGVIGICYTLAVLFDRLREE